MIVKKRSEAIASGEKRYFTGKPCPRGHICERVVSSRGCVECLKISYKKWSPKRGPRKQYESKKLWDSENREKKREYYRKWSRNNPGAARAATAAYKKKNKEKCLAWENIRRARMAFAEGQHDGQDILNKVQNQNGRCPYCQANLDEGMEVDHINPLSRGGSNGPENIQVLCRRCNRRKGAKTHDEFVEYLKSRQIAWAKRRKEAVNA